MSCVIWLKGGKIYLFEWGQNKIRLDPINLIKPTDTRLELNKNVNINFGMLRHLGQRAMRCILSWQYPYGLKHCRCQLTFYEYERWLQIFYKITTFRPNDLDLFELFSGNAALIFFRLDILFCLRWFQEFVIGESVGIRRDDFLRRVMLYSTVGDFHNLQPQGLFFDQVNQNFR